MSVMYMQKMHRNIQEQCGCPFFMQGQTTDVDRIGLTCSGFTLVWVDRRQKGNFSRSIRIIYYQCRIWLCACASHTRLPLNKYASLDGVDDAAEARFLFIASQHQAHLAGEGGGQPVPHL